MKIVSRFCPRLTGKYISFPCVHIRYIPPPAQLSGNFLQKTNIQNGHKLGEKWLNSFIFDNIIFYLVRALHRFKNNKNLSLCRLYYNYTRQKNNCLRFLVNTLITESLLK